MNDSKESRATQYSASNAEVDFSRADEAVRLENGRFAWPAIGGGWILRWNDRHGDLWNTRLPVWWSPDARFAWRINGETFSDYRALKAAYPRRVPSGSAQRITADLETGQEVSV